MLKPAPHLSAAVLSDELERHRATGGAYLPTIHLRGMGLSCAWTCEPRPDVTPPSGSEVVWSPNIVVFGMTDEVES